MNRAVWKFPLTILGTQTILAMPQDAHVVHVDVQQDCICLWAVVDPEAECEERTFQIVGTGHPEVTESMHHLGSVIQGPYVWHVFEVLS